MSGRKLACKLWLFAMVWWCAPPALAAAGLDVSDAWVRATVPGQPVAAAYMTLRSASTVRLVAIRANVAKAADIHSMTLDQGVMRMRQVDALAIPAGKPVTLAPNGLHLMLTGLARPLNPGDVVTIEFTAVDEGGRQTTSRVAVPVRSENPQ